MRTASLLALTVLAAGCVTIGGEEPVEQREYDIVLPMASGAPPEASGPERLQVDAFTVDPVLDREEMVWRQGDVETGAWGNHRWSRTPAVLVRGVLTESLRRAGVCAVVAADPEVPDPDFVLRGHLERFEERDGDDGWYGLASVVVTLETRDGREVLRRTLHREVRAGERNPMAVAMALRDALLAISGELATEVRSTLERERELAR